MPRPPAATEPSQPFQPPQLPFPQLTGGLEALRRRLSRLPILRHLTGGPEADVHVVLAQGLLASFMILIGSWGVGWLATSQESIFARAATLNMLRAETWVVLTCSLLLALGSMLLCRAWLRLGQRIMAGQAGMVAVRRAVLSWSAPMLASFPIYSRDVYSYLAQGRLMQQGMNPYENWVSQLPGWYAEGADSLWAESPSPYGPLFLLFARGTYFITGGVPEFGVLFFRVLAVAGVLACLYALPRLARVHGTDPGWAAWVCIANPFFLVTMVAGVHNDAVMVGGLLLGFLCVARGQRVLGVVWVSVAIAVKPIVVLALPFVGLAMLRARNDRESAAVTLRQKMGVWILTGSVAFVTLTLVGAVSGLWFGWITAMATAGSAAFPYAPIGLLGLLIGWIASLFGADTMTVASGVFAFFRYLAVALAFWWAFRRPAHQALFSCGLALTAAVVLAPVIQPWYLLWLAPLFAAYHQYGGHIARIWYAVSMVLVLLVVIEQVSVAQWIDQLFVQLVAALGGVVYLAYIMLVDPKTARLFTPLSKAIVRRRAVGRKP
ncbi:polyprenol phosphomannose-dependent alpha 1,6 mannosyltransferase MptB [Zhihengliuella halotolerans]|uniref:polyprenol phosphomannose-dependent alpha 1,6 mannosyltransferase MptB n=1 Tax=Zhihengliuella halotolerans TaxID=370736 RepID=UPI0015E12524|nr:polyprenol phosphomannose-dependent alpha 1,6 mannosyltransferase MptB [Zhihengliuella halotolerans]